MNYKEIFAREYKSLNKAQRAAVDQIDSTVMVLAGPGTGKTQLLAMRVANILNNTDIDASSILCLTFTESAATNMTERMVNLFGPQANRVSVNTFHSLGSEIINKYSQYFYNGAIFRPADELTTGEIIENILSTLPHSNLLSKKMNGKFTYLNDLISAISDLKRAGLLPQEADKIIDQNLDFCSKIAPDLKDVFTDRINKKTIDKAQDLLVKVSDLDKEYLRLDFANEPPLSHIIHNSLKEAISESEITGKTTSITQWKKNHITIDDDKNMVLRDSVNSQKLAAVNKVYAEYLRQMVEKNLYDYDDMILRVIHALEIFPSLKSELQEKYQYILVDEFQDTNDGQMRLLNNLTDYDTNPNIMVVGDDDQAIFRFQGADISNIQSFNNRYEKAKTIVLTDNYRSGKNILETATQISDQIQQRLNKMLDIEKNLNNNVDKIGKIEYLIATDAAHENAMIAEQINKEILSGINPSDIAIISRRHSDLEKLVPFLLAKDIPLNYEKHNNILSSEPVRILELLSRIVVAIADRNDDLANSMLPELLSHKAWGISPNDIWRISLESSRNHKYWLETMLGYSESTKAIAEWLILLTIDSRNQTLEAIIDKLFGNVSSIEDGEFQSPLYEYFFSKSRLNTNPSLYLEFLSNLNRLRQIIRSYKIDNNEPNRLKDLIELIDRYKDLGKTISATTTFNQEDKVSLLTVHKAKGLEFGSVYVVDASSQKWGEKSRSRNNLIKFPKNMPFQISGDDLDEQLRLLFVATTRAKLNLTISSHQISESGKNLLPLEYLGDIANLEPQTLEAPNQETMIQQLKVEWHSDISNTINPSTKQDLSELLSDKLSTYKLSATDLNKFIDISDGGPNSFLMRSLLRFPSAKSPAAIFGTAVHSVLQRAHTHLTVRGSNKPLEDILGDFENLLNDGTLNKQEYEFYLQKGVDALKSFYTNRIESFDKSQIVEYDSYKDNVTIGDARLTGKIDLIDIDQDNKTLIITDYKTGKAPRSWEGKTNYEKIKLHKYRQQLLFYKLLIEKSHQFRDFKIKKGFLEFVEPINDDIIRLEISYEQEELERFSKIINAVWTRIINLDFPEIEQFSKDYKGIIEFEEFLLQNSIDL